MMKQFLLLFTLCFAVTVNAQVNLTSGLVAYYPFAGNAADASGNNNNGTLSGSATIITDQWGNANSACNIAGPNNPGRVTVPNSATLQFSTTASFSFWFKLNSNVGTNGFGNIVAGGSHCLFAKDGDAGGGLFCLTALSGTNLAISIGNVSMTTLNYTYPNYSTGTWLHCVYIMDATEQRLYINANLVATVAGAPNFGTMNTKQLCLGRFGSNWYPLDGALDEFRVYNRVLNTSEITALATYNPAAISVTTVSPLTICAGGTVSADFTSSGVSAGNVYTLQLSDGAGSFTYPLTIGSLTSNASTGTIIGTIPEGVPSGVGYKVRITSNVPVSTGTASTQSITINGVLGDIPNPALFRYYGNLAGKNYYYCSALQTWTNAQSTCVSNGGNLASIPDAATNTFIKNAVITSISIGFTDQVTEGNFLWIDGSPVTYTNWNAGEPNNSGNEDYVQIYNTGVWNDVNAAATSPFMLQLRPASSNSPVCTGNPLTFFCPNLPGATFQWSGPNGFSSTQQNPVIANASLSNAGTYTLTITKNGCSATVTTDVVVTQTANAMGASSVLLPSLSSGLSLYYPLNGNANDASGNNLNGTLFGGTSVVADRFGNANGAIRLNGTNAYIDVPDGNYFSGGDFTVSCWVKTASYASWSRVFDFGNGPANNNVLVGISNGTTGRPAAEIYNGTVSGGQVTSPATQMPLNQWALLVYTFSSGTGKIYLNGTQLGTAIQTAPQNVFRTLCYIGRSNWAGDAYANASFDDFRIYNRTLTTTELNSLLLEQPDAMNLVAMPAAICPNTASQIKVIGTQFGVSYQLQNASTSTNIGAAQNGNGDTLSFATGNLAATTTFQVVATGYGTCSVIISSVTVSTITAANSPVTTGASHCGPGNVSLAASGAPNGALYYWYTLPVGGTQIFIGPNFTTPFLNSTTTYYVSVYANGCESNRTPVTATINSATAPAVDLYSGLIMYYKLDGNTADSSGRVNHATLTAGTYVNDRFSVPAHALSVVSNNYLDCGTPFDIQALTNQVSISMWINENYFAGGFMPLLNDWANTGLYSSTYGYWDSNGIQQNRVHWRIDGNTFVESNVNVPFNQWTNIVCTYNGATLKIYQDGQLTGSLNYSGNIGWTGTPTQIGRQANGSGSQIFAGTYDDIRVYNRALNADEAMSLYEGGVAFSNAPLCETSTLQLSSVAIAGATYSWSGPNGFSSSLQNPPAIPNVTTASAGTYSLTITNPNGCVSSPQLNTVVVNPLPGIPNVTNDTVCGSGNATLTASGGGTYLWYTNAVGGTPIPNQASGTYTITNLTATDTFYVSAVSPAGCESAGRTMVIAYFINPVQVNLPVSGSTVCANSNSATISIQNSQTGVSYQAFYNSSAVSSAVNGNGSTITLTVSTSGMNTGANTVTIVATQGSCGSVNLNNTATVYLNALPSAVITASGPTAICTGDNVTLTASAAASWLWSDNSVTQNIVVNQSGNYFVTVTDANGCSNTSSSVVVNVVAPPVAGISAAGPITFCQGDNVTLNASGGTSYVWSTGSTASSVSVSQAGTYYVIASNGACSDTSSTISVMVNPLPNVSFTMGADTFFCVNSPAYTLNGGIPAGGIYSGPGVSGGIFNAANAGVGYSSIDYTYADVNGCSAMAIAVVYVDVCTGTNIISEAMTLTAIPNPTTDAAIISWSAKSNVSILEVFDATGKLVLRENVSGKTAKEISLGGFSAGVYQVRLIGEEVLYLRLVKE
jgi:hypothetical protein